nr:hypothetical protein [Rickettsia sp. Tenjiku01]
MMLIIKSYVKTPVFDKMIEKQLIGHKGDGGFYRLSVSNGKKIKEVININDLSYSPVQKVDILILMRFL